MRDITVKVSSDLIHSPAECAAAKYNVPWFTFLITEGHTYNENTLPTSDELSDVTQILQQRKATSPVRMLKLFAICQAGMEVMAEVVVADDGAIISDPNDLAERMYLWLQMKMGKCFGKIDKEG